MSRRRRPTTQSIESTKGIYTEVKVSGETVKQDETVEKDTHVFTEDPAYVRVAVGVTNNLGNFESLRVDVAITMPCLPSDVEKCQVETAELAYRLLQEEVARMPIEGGTNA